jgi:hypothetical protein
MTCTKGKMWKYWFSVQNLNPKSWVDYCWADGVCQSGSALLQELALFNPKQTSTQYRLTIPFTWEPCVLPWNGLYLEYWSNHLATLGGIDSLSKRVGFKYIYSQGFTLGEPCLRILFSLLSSSLLNLRTNIYDNLAITNLSVLSEVHYPS